MTDGVIRTCIQFRREHETDSSLHIAQRALVDLAALKQELVDQQDAITMLEDDVRNGVAIIKDRDATIAALREENEKRGDLLKQLEWNGFKIPELGEGPSGAYNFCLICKAIKEDGHKEGCELRAALGQEGAE